MELARRIDSIFQPMSPKRQMLNFAVSTQLVILLSYFLFNIPYVLLWKLQIPFFEKYKIQQNVKPTTKDVVKASKVAFKNLFLVFPTLFLVGILAPRTAKFQVKAPSWKIFGLQLVFFQFMEDLTFYWSHRLMHSVPWLYKNVHKQHHEFTAPIGLASTYANIFDFLFGNLVQTVAGPLILQPHALTFWSWLTLRLWYTVDVHCGYKFPWGLEAFIGKLYAGPRHHDKHHSKFRLNYSSTLTYLDTIFGTDKMQSAGVGDDNLEQRMKKSL